MKPILIIVICFFFFSSCTTLRSHPRPWNKRETALAGYFVLGHLADGLSTERMLDNPNNYEMNPGLGRRPSDSKIRIYFSITGITVLIVSHFYPELRIPLLSLYGTAGFSYAVHNKTLIDN